jgi:hypothetical protein
MPLGQAKRNRMVGNRQKEPNRKKRETADEYEAHFYALIAKYKTRENPPSDDEKD